MREIDAVFGRELHIGDGHICAFDLAERISELDLRHVLPARQLRPARLRDLFRHGKRCAAARAAGLAAGEWRAAPLAFPGVIHRDRLRFFRRDVPRRGLRSRRGINLGVHRWRSLLGRGLRGLCVRRGRGTLDGRAAPNAEILAVADLRTTVYAEHKRSLFGVVMHVHRLDADASRPRHPRQRHVRAAEKARAEALELHVHGDRRILIKERAGFHLMLSPAARRRSKTLP